MDDDMRERLKPLCAVLRQHRITRLQVSGQALSEQAGKGQTWVTDLENGNRIGNPQLSRLILWANLVQAQEFGLYVTLNDVYTDIPLLTEKPE